MRLFVELIAYIVGCPDGEHGAQTCYSCGKTLGHVKLAFWPKQTSTDKKTLTKTHQKKKDAVMMSLIIMGGLIYLQRGGIKVSETDNKAAAFV